MRIANRPRLRDISRRLSDRAGGVALMFAVTAIPVVGLIGLAVDVGLITQAQAQLDAAADAAALAAAKTAADRFAAKQSDFLAAGRSAGLEWFASQSGTLIGASADTPGVTVTQTGAVFTSSVTYRGVARPFFAPLFGVGTVPLAGLAGATITTTAYVSVTFLLDNSSSMLIAATAADVTKMHDLTVNAYTTPNAVPDGLGWMDGGKKARRPCAFACHWSNAPDDYYALANANGIRLRFDVVQNAVATAVRDMIDQQQIADQFGLGIYTFNNALTKVYPPAANQTSSTNLSAGLAAAQNIRSPVVPDVANTWFPTIMLSLAAASPKAGDGSTVDAPKRALIIVTDGLADYGSRSIPTTQGPINPADCTAMKNLGYTVYVLYTTYITGPDAISSLLLPGNNIDMKPYIAGTRSPSMVGALQACASAPVNYAEASDPAAIDAAMGRLLKAALSNAGRFTN